MNNLVARKYRLIKLITKIDNELLIGKLESLFDEHTEGDSKFLNPIQPMQEELDIDALEQNHKHTSKELPSD